MLPIYIAGFEYLNFAPFMLNKKKKKIKNLFIYIFHINLLNIYLLSL